ncbi:MAG: DegT/DnrJ/EryC1/StrS family aminotransferase [Acidobacteria bacterium]|nr:DegT/DnrJ/EryC1/StrS family aminotransferase [Acidobacteriota bacterium]
MHIPVVNFRPVLEATRQTWEENLRQLMERQWFILGDQVRAFERDFAAAMSAEETVGCGNGTDAIQLCLRAAGVTSPKQEVITTALTAPFSGIGIISAGCSIRFADIDPGTLQLDPDDAGNRIRKATAALMPVHLYGQPCRIDRFARLARQHRLALIQDACQAHGAQYQAKPLSAFSPYIAYSFYPTKNLGCLGDGGAIATNRKTTATLLRQLRDGGRRGGQVTYRAGINSRLDEMQACYLRAFLPHLKSWNEHRQAIAALYDEALRDCPGVQLVERTKDSVCHLYVIRAAKREKLRAFLAERGIGTGVHYPVPMHLHPTFAACGLRKGDLPHTEKACREVVSLPLWPYIPRAAALEVAEKVREYYRGSTQRKG